MPHPRELQLLDLAKLPEHAHRVVDGCTASRAAVPPCLLIEMVDARMLLSFRERAQDSLTLGREAMAATHQRTDQLVVAPPASRHGSDALENYTPLVHVVYDPGTRLDRASSTGHTLTACSQRAKEIAGATSARLLLRAARARPSWCLRRLLDALSS